MKTLLISIITFSLSLSAGAQNSALLKLNLEQNKTYRLKSTSQQNMSQSMGGMQNSTVVNSTNFLSLKMIEKSADFMVVEFRFDSIIINTQTAGMNIDINSNKPGDIQSENIGEVLSLFMNRYCSNPLYAKMTYEGKVLDFVNLKLFTDMMLKDVDSIKTQMAQMIKSRAKMMADSKTIQSSIESIMAYLPGKQVETGGTWDVSLYTNSGGMEYHINSHYTLKDIKDNKADITFDSTLDPANSGPVQMNGNTITNNIRGTSKSNMTIDTTDGMLIESSGKFHMEGDMGVEAQGRSMTIPTAINGETSVVLLP